MEMRYRWSLYLLLKAFQMFLDHTIQLAIWRDELKMVKRKPQKDVVKCTMLKRLCGLVLTNVK
jgi:hypothetical protein